MDARSSAGADPASRDGASVRPPAARTDPKIDFLNCRADRKGSRSPFRFSRGFVPRPGIGRLEVLPFERLMGLILVAISVEMLLKGIRIFAHQL